VRLVSAGGVIFRVVSGVFEVALIFSGGVWWLPKGLVEAGESFEGAALREVKEETGFDGEIVGKIGENSYFFTRGGKRYLKTVHLYLMRCVGGSADIHDSEADYVRWFKISEALQVLRYPNERKIVAKAEWMLKQ
jgi:8-oxo-dGTP pyrophosphatase MutT (NUDIX family)